MGQTPISAALAATSTPADQSIDLPERGSASDPLQTIALLADLFPKCFFVYGRRRRPLRLGIDKDIADALGSDAGIKAALRLYVSNYEYRRKLKTGAPRIDLDGNAAGTVSAEEAQFAEKLVAKAARRRQLAIEAEAKSKEPPAPKRISLSDLRASALAKKAAMSGAAK